MLVQSAWDNDNRVLIFEPDAKMPIGEAYLLHGFDGGLITTVATDEWQIHGIEKNNSEYYVQAGDRKVHVLSADTLVYVKFSDLKFERREIANKARKIQDAKNKYGLIKSSINRDLETHPGSPPYLTNS